MVYKYEYINPLIQFGKKCYDLRILSGDDKIGYKVIYVTQVEFSEKTPQKEMDVYAQKIMTKVTTPTTPPATEIKIILMVGNSIDGFKESTTEVPTITKDTTEQTKTSILNTVSGLITNKIIDENTKLIATAVN